MCGGRILEFSKCAYSFETSFPLQPHPSETFCCVHFCHNILLCPLHLFCPSVCETMKYATFRYDTAEVENGLKYPLLFAAAVCVNRT